MAAMAASRGTAARVGTESRRVSGRGRTRVVRTRATAREGDDDAEGRDDGRDGMTELTDAFAGVGREVYDDFAYREDDAAFGGDASEDDVSGGRGGGVNGVNGSALGVSIAEATRASEEESQQEVETKPHVPMGVFTPEAQAIMNSGRERESNRVEDSDDLYEDEVPGVYADGEGWTGGGFDSPEGMIALPLSYYQILGLSAARSTPNSLPRAALAVMDAPLTEGYSAFMLEQRLSLIDEAVAVLKDEDARKQHDEDIREGILTPVEPERAAAALCLLQEAGEYEAVLEFEHVVAQCAHGRRHRRDVALTVALALCEYGHMALVANPPRIAEGCELIEMGSKTLSAVGTNSFAPEVRRNIAMTYHDMAPGYVLELLSMPLESKAERALGLRALRSLLWTKDPSQALEKRADFMEQANELLTAREQTALFIDAPDYIPADSDEVYKSALAHVVAGVIERKPMMIADASEILDQIQLASKHSDNVGHFSDVGVERAVCQLLLGQIEEAEHSLGLYDGSADPGLVQFIEDRSPSGDYVEGLCAMADQWLADVAFPLFRGAAEQGAPTLEEWFATPNVQGFVSRMNSFAAVVRIQGVMEAAKRAIVHGVESITTAFTPTPPALQFGVSDARRRATAVAKIGVVAGATFVASGRGGFIAPSVPKIQPFAPIRAAVGSTGAALSNIKMPKIDVKTATRDNSRRDAPKPRAPTPPPTTMNYATAERLVRKWQTAKAQALGQNHNTRLLEGILDGPMLQQWTTRANDVAAHGWAWEYKLNKLSIDSVQVVGANKVLVETTLTEVAVLKDRSRNEPDDVYESTYRTKYELKRAESGGKHSWRIVGGSVVY